MFCTERITGIKASHRVPEVGPGAAPHPHADVVLATTIGCPAEHAKQFSHVCDLLADRVLVQDDGTRLPFPDKAFDYMIGSHVVEHVPDAGAFVSECFRVAMRGYFEHPLCDNEYLHNFDVHLNLVKYTDGSLRDLRKSDTAIDSFRPVQAMRLDSPGKCYNGTVNHLLPWMMEGFSWDRPFAVERVHDLRAVCHAAVDEQARREPSLRALGPRRLLRELIASIRTPLLPTS